MKTLKETSPALAVLSDDVVYYASTIPENLGGMRFQYQGHDYSLYNRDETEYELIHWLSGEDALDNGMWRDKSAIDGALDFENHGCTWNEEHTGYYSADSWAQYFVNTALSELDFGDDWYMEVVANIGEPLGTSCFIVDFNSLSNAAYGIGIGLKGEVDYRYTTGRIATNGTANGMSATANTGDVGYKFGETALFIEGVNRYSINQSRAFITWDGNRYYSVPFKTVQWNKWTGRFYLFRGVATTWGDGEGFNNIYRCGPTTIYDIKIWRKK